MLRLEKVRAHLDREAPGDLRHGLEQRVGSVGPLHRLVGDPEDPLFLEDLGQGRARRKVEVGEERLAVLEQVVLRRKRLLHLEDKVGRPPDLRRLGHEGCPGRTVLGVGEAGAIAGRFLDDDLGSKRDAAPT